MPDQYAIRRKRLRALVADRDYDALLVTRLVNVRYLTGLASSNAALLVPTAGSPVLATDFRYAERARTDCGDVELVVTREVATGLAARAEADGVRRLAIEAHVVTMALHDALAAAAGSVAFTDAGQLVEALRTVKDETEIDAIRTACGYADEAFARVVDAGLAGRTEREVGRRLDRAMEDAGADGPGFATIVAAGPHAAVPHHELTDRPLQRGDLVVCDFGACCRGYRSDMTRTLIIGASGGWQRDLYDLVRRAHAAGCAALRPGADATRVDAAARDVIAAAGHGDDFGHGLGHGVGLEVHEAPALSQTATGKLAAGMPVTIEPGVYLPGRGGVRIEDTLVVRDGVPEQLTTSTADLLVC